MRRVAAGDKPPPYGGAFRCRIDGCVGAFRFRTDGCAVAVCYVAAGDKLFALRWCVPFLRRRLVVHSVSASTVARLRYVTWRREINCLPYDAAFRFCVDGCVGGEM
ncbi:MAG: hypothetical protein IJB65_03610 [Clostridia bacterium]|nr:hypothetical protein [Clostridia bacterium]